MVPFRSIITARRKRIALIAHDNLKPDILEWARYNRDTLTRHDLYGTGTTGGMIASELDLDVQRFRSGPLGGDQQVGAGVAEGRICSASPSSTTCRSRATARPPTFFCRVR